MRETYGCNDRARMRIIYYFYRGSLTVAIFLPERSIDGGRMGGLFSRERLGEVCEAICMVFVPGWNDCVPCSVRELGYLFEWMLIAGYSFDSWLTIHSRTY